MLLLSPIVLGGAAGVVVAKAASGDSGWLPAKPCKCATAAVHTGAVTDTDATLAGDLQGQHF